MRDWFCFLKTIALANLVKPKKPFKVNFAITYRCNYRCKTCNIWKKPKKEELSLQEIRKIFSKASYLQWISLTGGEPFLREDIDKIASVIKEFCNPFILNIPTNGSIPNRIYKKVRRICELGIRKTCITISLDGPKNLHNEIRGTSDAWKKCIKTFSLLKELESEFRNFKVFFEFTLSPFNLGMFEETVEEAKSELDVSANDFYITFFHVSEHYYSNPEMRKLYGNFRKNLYRELSNIRKARKHALSAEKFLGDLYLSLADKNPYSSIKCCALSCSCFIDPYGTVYPCIVLNHSVGNLRNNSYNLTEIVLSKNSDSVRKKVEKCKLCWTPCEANQTILANIFKASMLYLKDYFNKLTRYCMKFP